MSKLPTFVVDKYNSDDEYCYVDITGIGTVVIKKDEEGIAVDIFPLHVVDEPVASCWALYSELTEEE